MVSYRRLTEENLWRHFSKTKQFRADNATLDWKDVTPAPEVLPGCLLRVSPKIIAVTDSKVYVTKSLWNELFTTRCAILAEKHGVTDWEKWQKCYVARDLQRWLRWKIEDEAASAGRSRKRSAASQVRRELAKNKLRPISFVPGRNDSDDPALYTQLKVMAQASKEIAEARRSMEKPLEPLEQISKQDVAVTPYERKFAALLGYDRVDRAKLAEARSVRKAFCGVDADFYLAAELRDSSTIRDQFALFQILNEKFGPGYTAQGALDKLLACTTVSTDAKYVYRFLFGRELSPFAPYRLQPFYLDGNELKEISSETFHSHKVAQPFVLPNCYKYNKLPKADVVRLDQSREIYPGVRAGNFALDSAKIISDAIKAGIPPPQTDVMFVSADETLYLVPLCIVKIFSAAAVKHLTEVD